MKLLQFKQELMKQNKDGILRVGIIDPVLTSSDITYKFGEDVRISKMLKQIEDLPNYEVFINGDNLTRSFLFLMFHRGNIKIDYKIVEREGKWCITYGEHLVQTFEKKIHLVLNYVNVYFSIVEEQLRKVLIVNGWEILSVNMFSDGVIKYFIKKGEKELYVYLNSRGLDSEKEIYFAPPTRSSDDSYFDYIVGQFNKLKGI